MNKANQTNKIKYLKDSEIKAIANEFLIKNNPKNEVPVPIEYIAEYNLGLSIIPTKDLKRVHGIEAFINSTQDKIFLDQYCYENYEERTRFTIAHEIAHIVLHKDFYQSLKIQTEEEYLSFQDNENIETKKRVEAQAYVFTGYLLLPETLFNPEFQKLVKDVHSIDVEQLQQIMAKLSEQFCVSGICIYKQLQKEYPEFMKEIEKLV